MPISSDMLRSKTDRCWT